MAEGHDEHLQKVPVTFDGFEVGQGFLSSDGHILLVRLNDSPVANEVRSRMKSDPERISINPRNTQL